MSKYQIIPAQPGYTLIFAHDHPPVFQPEAKSWVEPVIAWAVGPIEPEDSRPPGDAVPITPGGFREPSDEPFIMKTPVNYVVPYLGVADTYEGAVEIASCP